MTKKEYSDWLKPVKSMPDKGHCVMCKKTFDVGNMGISAVVSHAASKKHMQKLEENKKTTAAQIPIHLFACNTAKSDVQSAAVVERPATSSETPSTVIPSSNTPAIPTSNSSGSEPKSSSVMPQTQTSVSAFVQRQSVTTAEILWTLKSVMSNYSYNSAAGLNDLFQIMFPDSDIAKRFQLGSTKMAYFFRFGLAPIFRSQLLAQVQKCDHYVLAFDESLNKMTQRGQMDVHIRFFDDSKNQVCTR
jgi:hypothetical protein